MVSYTGKPCFSSASVCAPASSSPSQGCPSAAHRQLLPVSSQSLELLLVMGTESSPGSLWAALQRDRAMLGGGCFAQGQALRGSLGLGPVHQLQEHPLLREPRCRQRGGQQGQLPQPAAEMCSPQSPAFKHPSLRPTEPYAFASLA